MRRPAATAAARRWQVTLIFTIFAVAVAAAAGAGWWYARESTPHQGPIILMSIDGLRPASLQAYGGSANPPRALDALAADAVVFERAYAHSPLTRPAHASLFAGQLPFEHGVRDEAGFTLGRESPSIAELLRSRGFETGGAVSSFLLRAESGLARGFSFFDAELPDTESASEAPAVERDGAQTVEAAETWLRARRGHRFFLFVQVQHDAAEEAVARLVAELKTRNLYDQATIVLTADRAAAAAKPSFDVEALHVPLLVKQPEGEGAGRRIEVPVQHIDLLPTILDFVRAPRPSGLRGRSLRAVLSGDEEGLGDPVIYAESLAPRFRFGGAATFALVSGDHRYVRRNDDESAHPGPTVDLGGELERLLADYVVAAPGEIDPAEEDQFAMLGYLGGSSLAGSEPSPLNPDDETRVDSAHREAAALAGRKQYAAAISHLREIVRRHPRLAVVQYQLGILLARIGRNEEAERAFRAAAAVNADDPSVPIAVARLRLRAGRPEAARDAAALGVALAERTDSRARAAAHQVAARVALALDDAEAAERHADAVEREEPRVPVRGFVRGRLLFAAGQHEQARALLEKAVAWLDENGSALEELHWSLGETLARLEQFEAAEQQFRAELRAFPRNIRAYSSLALLYRASNRTSAVEETLDALVTTTRTPDGYETAARLWTIMGEPAKATELRAQARTRFRR